MMRININQIVKYQPLGYASIQVFLSDGSIEEISYLEPAERDGILAELDEKLHYLEKKPLSSL
jgi:hypothetical protein